MRLPSRLGSHPSLLSISSSLPTINPPTLHPNSSPYRSNLNHKPFQEPPQFLTTGSRTPPSELPLLSNHTTLSSNSLHNPLQETPESLSRSKLVCPQPSHFSILQETPTSLSPKQAHFSIFLTNPLQETPQLLLRSKTLSPKPHHFSVLPHNQLQETSQFLTRSATLSPKPSPFSPFLHKPLQESPQLAPSAKQPHFSIFLTNPFQGTPQFLSRSRASIRQFSSSDSMDRKISSPIQVNSTLASPFDDSLSSPINASSSIRKPLSLWPGTYHSPVTNALWEARSQIFERLLDPASDDGPPQTELLTKTAAQSRTAIVYNFSSDYILREQYRDPWNEVRIGKLLEDLDALAGTIAVKHCSDDDSTTRPLLLVTASVDKMVLNKPIRVDTDLKISGAVTWAGRSSIEIQMKIAQTPQENSIPSDPIVLTACFTFVARDSKTGKAAAVNHLLPQTEQEKKLMEEGEARKKLWKKQREEKKREFETGGHSFHGEVERLETLLAEGRVFCDLPALADRNSILIRDTCLENSLICQPQQRNLHGRIFGGFLMHRAFELAFSTAYAFVGQRPRFLEVDHVDFLKPVDVGDFLRFKSCVLYTQLENLEEPLINVEVVAHVTRPELRTSEVSNTFYFTFTVNPDALKNGLRIRNVVPATEEEARRVLERMEAEKIYS